MVKTKTEKIYIILIALFVIGALAVVIVGLTGRGAEEPVPTPAPMNEVTVKEVEKLVEVEKIVEVEKEITAEMIEDGLNDMGVLLTEEYYFTEVVSFSSIKKFLSTEIKLPFTETAYLAGYSGVVNAGIDFSAVTVEKDEGTKRISVHIPKAEIQNIDIDPDSFELYSEKVGLGNPLSVEDFNNSLIELESTAAEKAVGRGLLDRADENAKTLIENFVRGLVDMSVYSLEITN